MNVEQINALNRFALKHGRTWRASLSRCWVLVKYPRDIGDTDAALLQQLRNNGGPAMLATFQPREDGYQKVGYLKRDQMEVRSATDVHFGSAWRIVDADEQDLIQPWDNLLSSARDTAWQTGIYLAKPHQA